MQRCIVSGSRQIMDILVRSDFKCLRYRIQLIFVHQQELSLVGIFSEVHFPGCSFLCMCGCYLHVKQVK